MPPFLDHRPLLQIEKTILLHLVLKFMEINNVRLTIYILAAMPEHCIYPIIHQNLNWYRSLQYFTLNDLKITY